MGRLHAKAYAGAEGVRFVGVYDADPDAAAETAEQFNTQPFTDLGALLAITRAVSVATPTTTHLAVAERAIGAGVACLIEKPLAIDVAQCRRIVELSKQHGVVVQVGHIERFNPVVRSMSQLSIRPRFIEVIRISPLTFRSIDVGVVLDMMIHDIDIVLMLAQSPVEQIDAVGVSVIGDAEDVCNARLRFASGCVANLTVSRLALKTERRLRVFSEDAYVSLDFQKKYGIVARKGENLAGIRDTVAKIRTGEIDDLSQINYADLVHVEELQINDTEPIRAEIASFVQAVRTGTRPVVSAEDGLAAVELAMRIIDAIGVQKLD